jgi:bifunctional DNA-binding transcriptional regulator/antitoxin component of YhaV-PrlF toxin-antitoxin module
MAGNSSLAITLPMPWIRFFELKRGDSVEVISNGVVTITPIKRGKR